MAILFSDGFETGDLSKWTSQGPTPPTVQNTVKKFGNYALQADTSDVNERQYTQKDLGAGKLTLHTREYVMVNPIPAASQYIALFDNNSSSTVGDPAGLYWYVSLGADAGGTGQLWFNPSVGSNFIIKSPVVANEWHCIEVRWVTDAVVGEWEVWLDGISVGSDAGLDTTVKGAGGPRYVTVGTTFVSNVAAGFAYCDSVIIAEEYIGPEDVIAWMGITGGAVLG